MRGNYPRARTRGGAPSPGALRAPTSPRKRGEVNRVRGAFANSTQSHSALRMTPCETQPRLDLGDLGAAYGNAMRRRPIKLDHRAVAFLAHQGDMRNRDDMAAMHPNEQAGIELRFGFRDRPRTHPLTGAVMDQRIMGISPDAPHAGRIDKVSAVG